MRTAVLLPFLAIVALLTMLPTAGAADDPLTVLAPRDKSVLQSRVVNIIVQVDTAAADGLQVKINDRRQVLPRKQLGGGHICYIDGLEISPGINRIKVIAVKNGAVTGARELTLFLRSDLSPDGQTAPDGFTAYVFHGAGNDRACTPCHRIDDATTEQNLAAPEKSPCYLCHRKLMASSVYLHGPASVWSCTSCHRFRQGTSGASSLETDSQVCANCHGDSQDLWKSMKNMHGPTAAGECTTCHDPHASDHKYILRKQTVDLCLTCHDEIASKPHVVSGFSGKGHPLRLSSDPLRPGQEFTCASCHNPHASNSPFLLIAGKGSSDNFFEFCKSCHNF